MRVSLLLSLTLCLTLGACTGDVGADTDLDTDSDLDSDTEADTAADVNTASLSGVTFGSSYAIPGTRVQLCAADCSISTVSNSSGEYEIKDIPPGTYSIEVYPPEGWENLIPSAPITFTAGQNTDLNPMWIQPSTAVGLFDTGEPVEIAPGLQIQFDSADSDIDASEWAILGASIPNTWLLPVELDKEILAAWYLGPYDTRSTEGGFNLIFDNTRDLTVVDTLEVWVNVHNNGVASWELAGTLIGGQPTLTGDVSIPRLATVVLVEAE